MAISTYTKQKRINKYKIDRVTLLSRDKWHDRYEFRFDKNVGDTIISRSFMSDEVDILIDSIGIGTVLNIEYACVSCRVYTLLCPEGIWIQGRVLLKFELVEKIEHVEKSCYDYIKDHFMDLFKCFRTQNYQEIENA